MLSVLRLLNKQAQSYKNDISASVDESDSSGTDLSQLQDYSW